MEASRLSILLAIMAPILGLVGVLVGTWTLRARDLRETRRRAYVEWQQTAENLPVFENPAGTAIISLPTIAMIRKLRELTTEIAVVGSKRVLDSANAFIAVVASSNYAQTMNQANLTTVEDTLRLHDTLSGAARLKVMIEMRRDLLPWWHVWSRKLPEQEHKA